MDLFTRRMESPANIRPCKHLHTLAPPPPLDSRQAAEALLHPAPSNPRPSTTLALDTSLPEHHEAISWYILTPVLRLGMLWDCSRILAIPSFVLARFWSLSMADARCVIISRPPSHPDRPVLPFPSFPSSLPRQHRVHSHFV